MSNGPIPLIADTELEFAPVQTDFTGLLAGELGNLGTDHDGFDTLFNDAASLAADAGTALESFDGDLTDMGVAVPQADSSNATAQLAELQPAAAAIDASLNDYTALNPVPVPDAGGGGATPPPPPAAPQNYIYGGQYGGTPPAGVDVASSAVGGGSSGLNSPPADIGQDIDIGKLPPYVEQDFSIAIITGDATRWAFTKQVYPPGTLVRNPVTDYFARATFTPLFSGTFIATAKITFPSGDPPLIWQVTAISP